ncbi:MAG TPA: twin-arginine translocase TatA/TatE family subunit [Thermomicrobiales bacterium]|nr:twin-arginine translocase TatA/TatE family subunit [Thermomicrobiales bacterium]
MAGLGWQELTIVLVIVVIIFGAGKLPEIGGALGKSIKEFKNESEEQDGKPIASTSTTTKTEPKVVEAREVREVRADEI